MARSQRLHLARRNDCPPQSLQRAYLAREVSSGVAQVCTDPAPVLLGEILEVRTAGNYLCELGLSTGHSVKTIIPADCLHLPSRSAGTSFYWHSERQMGYASRDPQHEDALEQRNRELEANYSRINELRDRVKHEISKGRQ